MIFDHPHLSGLFGDSATAARLSADASMRAMLAFETALADAEATADVIPAKAAAAIVDAISTFTPDVEALRRAAARDGVVVPELVSQLRTAVGEPHGRHVHFGATSQDVVDTAFALCMAPVFTDFADRLSGVLGKLQLLDQRDGALIVQAHTRMQRAVAVPVSRKIASWRDPLQRSLDRIEQVRKQVELLHFGGAAGTLDKLGDAGETVARYMAGALDLRWAEGVRHSERDGQVGLADWLSSVTSSLGKMGQDICLMAQNEIGEVRLASGGGSSAMPHKVNPIGAELLVTLARFNATQVGGMHQAAVHENERSGAAWSLEWMLLPQMAMATACALRTADGMLDTIRFSATGTAS